MVHVMDWYWSCRPRFVPRYGITGQQYVEVDNDAGWILDNTDYIDSLVQERCNSSALAMELL